MNKNNSKKKKIIINNNSSTLVMNPQLPLQAICIPLSPLQFQVHSAAFEVVKLLGDLGGFANTLFPKS